MTDEPAYCCVATCPTAASHWRRFRIAADGWGEVEVTAGFCCRHLDLLSSPVLHPSLELTVAAVEVT